MTHFQQRLVPGLTLLLLVAMTRAWTTISPKAIQRGRDSSSRTLPSVQMSKNGSEAGGNSYEEQYNAFTKQQKEQQQRNEGPRIVPQPNQIDENPTRIPLQSVRRTNPIRKQEEDYAKQQRDRKAEEELEMAFMDFISCYPTKQGPQMGSVKPPKEEQHTKEKKSYLDIDSLLQDTKDFLKDRVRTDDDVVNPSNTEEVGPPSAFHSTESNPPESTESVGSHASSKANLDSAFQSAESTDTSSTSSDTVDGRHFTTKRPLFSDSKSYLENLATEIRSVGSEISNLGSEIVNKDQTDDDNSGDLAAEPNIDELEIESKIEVPEPITKSDHSDNDVVDSLPESNLAESEIKSIIEAPDLNTKAASPTDNGSMSRNKKENYTVEVKVETTFPTGITVEGAKNGWLEFCWAKGGGIVVPTEVDAKTPSALNSTDFREAPSSIKFQTEQSKNKAKAKEVDKEASEDLNLPTGIPSARELMVPYGLKQELISSTSTLDNMHIDTIRRDVVTYKTTEHGFFCKDMIEGTHEGRVEFIGASYTSTRMIWTVTFQVEQDKEKQDLAVPHLSFGLNTTSNAMNFATNAKTMMKSMTSKANLWGSWSQFQLKTASQNLLSYLDNSAESAPVMEHTEILPLGVSPKEAMQVWYDYYWKNGGGSVPVVLSPVEGSDKRWVIPSGLEEELVSLEFDHPVSESGVVGVNGQIATETEIAVAEYRVNNPNLLTYPVYYHHATVRFVRDGESSPTQLFWKVKVKPYRKFLGGGVLFWTKNGVALAAKKLRNYFELKQLEKRKKEIEAQLERLREKNPSKNITSNTVHGREERHFNSPSEKFKNIQATVSIVTGSETHPVSGIGSIHIGTDQGSSDNGTTEQIDKSLETPTTASSQETESQSGSATIVIPPPESYGRPTMPIDSYTRGIDDRLENDLSP